MCLFTRANAVFSCALSRLCGGAVSNCTSSNNKHCWQGKRPALRFDPWPQPNSFYSTLIKNHHSRLFLARLAYLHTNQRPNQAYITSNLFHLCPDVNDKLIHRTNSIITNNPHCWQAHKKSLDEWVVYLLGCTQCRVQAWPAKMPLHYVTTEQSAAQPAPMTSHTEEIGY